MVLVARCVCSLSSLVVVYEKQAAKDLSSIDLFVDCFFERNVPRGGYHQPLLIVVLGLWLAGNYPGVQTSYILTQRFVGLCTHRV